MIKAPAELNLKEHNGLPDLSASPQHIMSNIFQMATTSASDQTSQDIDDEVCRSLQLDSEVMAPPSMVSTTSKYDNDLGARVSDSAVEILSYEDSSLEHQQSMDACSSSGFLEMLEQDSGNEDILQLLQRRRVSTFLCSDFRDRMDNLMVSQFQKQNDLLALPEDAQIHLEIPMLVSTLALACSSGQHQQDDVGESVQERERDQLQMEESGPRTLGR
ncbi:hypothetical protein MLD38_009911 [Melastoma candidum]|uniref:Uncharacterized protein n=1 Tax=Melastoma candidum TaxID=119954 RepID=A0ACB9QZF2_9MYRT|nr:hypothetical protein MLD38_009911 [Melastoma candidum]